LILCAIKRVNEPHSELMQKTSRKSVADFVDVLQRKGRYTFTKSELIKATGESDAVLKLSLWRLARKHRIVLIRRGFYVIIPLEYASGGYLPPEWFIADLMKYIGQPYYVGLLSAAAIHGASHQQPQELHVVISTTQRIIRIGPLRIRFFKKADMNLSPTEESKTPTGYMLISNPAITALDLVAYATRVGGLDRVLTVLQELGEKITSEMLLEAAKKESTVAYVQRLGWLLEKAGHDEAVKELAGWISSQKLRETALDSSSQRKGASRERRWKVIVNTEVQGDL